MSSTQSLIFFLSADNGHIIYRHPFLRIECAHCTIFLVFVCPLICRIVICVGYASWTLYHELMLCDVHFIVEEMSIDL